MNSIINSVNDWGIYAQEVDGRIIVHVDDILRPRSGVNLNVYADLYRTIAWPEQ